MTDIDRVIKGFECCHIMVHDLGPDKSSCGICPYRDVQTEEQIQLGGIECIAVLHDEAMALLKERKAALRREYERGYKNGRADEAGLRDGTIMQTFSP